MGNFQKHQNNKCPFSFGEALAALEVGGLSTSFCSHGASGHMQAERMQKHPTALTKHTINLAHYKLNFYLCMSLGILGSYIVSLHMTWDLHNGLQRHCLRWSRHARCERLLLAVHLQPHGTWCPECQGPRGIELESGNFVGMVRLCSTQAHDLGVLWHHHPSHKTKPTVWSAGLSTSFCSHGTSGHMQAERGQKHPTALTKHTINLAHYKLNFYLCMSLGILGSYIVSLHMTWDLHNGLQRHYLRWSRHARCERLLLAVHLQPHGTWCPECQGPRGIELESGNFVGMVRLCSTQAHDLGVLWHHHPSHKTKLTVWSAGLSTSFCSHGASGRMQAERMQKHPAALTKHTINLAHYKLNFYLCISLGILGSYIVSLHMTWDLHNGL